MNDFELLIMVVCDPGEAGGDRESTTPLFELYMMVAPAPVGGGAGVIVDVAGASRETAADFDPAIMTGSQTIAGEESPPLKATASGLASGCRPCGTATAVQENAFAL
jgi:hypothetical protein